MDSIEFDRKDAIRLMVAVEHIMEMHLDSSEMSEWKKFEDIDIRLKRFCFEGGEKNEENQH